MAKHSDRTILVTGATGHQGGAVLRHLREKNFPVRAVTRDANSPKGLALMHPGVEVVSANLEDSASLNRAMEDVFGVYSVQAFTGTAEDEVRQGKNVVEAANRAGVRHFVYSSVAGADGGSGIPHFESKLQVEDHLKTTGLPYTIFRPVSFMDNWLDQREQILQSGSINLPLNPETRLQMVACDDIGAFVTKAFENSGHWNARTFELAGDEVSYADQAAAMSRASNREIKYNQISWDDFQKGAGEELSNMFRWFEERAKKVDLTAVRLEYPQLQTFERWLTGHWPQVKD